MVSKHFTIFLLSKALLDSEFSVFRELQKPTLNEPRSWLLNEISALHALTFESAWSSYEFGSILEGGAFSFLCFSNNVLIGFIFAYNVLDEAEIITICVHPDHRRKGVGEALLSSLMTHQMGSIVLEVKTSNQKALYFYEKNGFQIVGQRKRYYEDGGDAWVMRYSHLNL